jgi:hypothetical protein
MNIFLLALIGALLVVAILLIGRFTLGRRIPIEWAKIAWQHSTSYHYSSRTRRCLHAREPG